MWAFICHRKTLYLYSKPYSSQAWSHQTKFLLVLLFFHTMDNLSCVPLCLPQSQASIVSCQNSNFCYGKNRTGQLVVSKEMFVSINWLCLCHLQNFPYISCAYIILRLFPFHPLSSVVSTLVLDTEEVFLYCVFVLLLRFPFSQWLLTQITLLPLNTEELPCKLC